MALAIDPDLFIRAPHARPSITAPTTGRAFRDLRASARRLALPAGAPNLGIPMFWIDCTASTTVATPGAYVGLTSGITFTLAASARGGTVRIKALATPISVIDAGGAPFDAGLTTFTLANPNEAVSLTWSAGDSSWLVGG